MHQRLNDEQLDALIRQVFGEPEARDLEIVQAAPTDAVAAEETILRNVRHTLGSLSDVPECQLDFSRVQRAIAGDTGGAKNRWRWLGYAVPVAACAAFAIWLGGRPQMVMAPPSGSGNALPESGKALYGRGAGAQNDPSPSSGITVPPELVPPTPVMIDPATAQAEMAQATRRAASQRRPSTKRGPTLVAKAAPVAGSTLAEIASTAAGLLMGAGEEAATLNRGATPAPPSTTVGDTAASAVVSYDSASSEPRTIVVVGGGSTLDSRANSAMEVDKRDVVFGG